MSFASVLSKIGAGLLTGVKIAQPVVAQVGAAIPGPDTFDAVAGILGTAEYVGELVQAQTGTKLEKIQLALPQIQRIIRHTELVSQHDIADEALFNQGCQEILEGTLKVTKSLKEKDKKIG